MPFHSKLKNLIEKTLPASIILLIEIALRMKRKQPLHILKVEPTYKEDGLFTNHNCEFMQDPLFKEAYDLGYSSQ